MKKLTFKQHVAIYSGLFIAGVVLALISYVCSKPLQPHFTLWLAIACIFAGVVWRVIFIKCPHCGDGLYGSRVIPKHCPNCGKDLNTNFPEGDIQ